MKINRMKIFRITLIVLVILLLAPWKIWVEQRSDPYERRQVWIDGIFYTVVLDDVTSGLDQSSGVNIHIPDIYCYEHIGGYTGQVYIGIYKGNNAATGGAEYHNLIINVYGGDWWGSPHEYRLGNWCASPIHQWRTSLLGGQ